MRDVRLIPIAIGLTLGNLLCAGFTSEWGLALDRSFFQAFALLAVWISMKLPRHNQSGDSI